MRSFWLAALAVLLLVSGAEAQSLRWAASGDPNTMDPHSQNVGTVTMMMQQIYDPLIARSRSLGLDPALATRRPHQLSGGQRQRVALARALFAQPAVLVMDEATSALDATARRQILTLVGELTARRGLAVVLVSHDLAAVRGLADEVLVMDHGRVVERGPAEALFTSPQHPVTRTLLAAAALDPDQAD